MRNFAHKLASSCAVGAMLTASAAFAQDDAAVSEESEVRQAGLSTIVVTATRTGETDLQTTPIAVTALSAEALEQRNVGDLQDVALYVPGLSIGNRTSGGAAFGAISIRGMGVDAQESAAAVGTYVDDVFFASARGNIVGLMDAERVEVLRGPQGTLFGRNTIAGAIQYVTRAPEHELGGYLSGKIGNFGRVDVTGALNVPVSDTLAVRFAGQYNSIGGYVYDELNDERRGAMDTRAARVRVRWEPTDRLRVDLKGEYVEIETNGRPTLVTDTNALAQFVGIAEFIAAGQGTTIGGVLDNTELSPNLNPGDYRTRGYNTPDGFDYTQKLVQGTIQYELANNVTLRSITSGAWYDAAVFNDLDATPLSILATYNGETNDVFTQELQLSGRALEDRLGFTLGGYYFNGSQDGENPVAVGPSPLDDTAGVATVKTESIAVYTQLSYDLTEQVTATAGLRYTNEDISSQLNGANTGFIPGPSGPAPGSFQPLTFDPVLFNFTDWSPYFGIDFAPTPDVFLFAKASKGFRAGGFTPNKFVPGGGVSFDPETAWTYELGARIEALDGRLRFNPTLFHTDWTNIQFLDVRIFSGNPVALTANSGDARIRGLELETQFAATDNLTLQGTFSYLDGKYTRIVPSFRTQWRNGFNPVNPGPPTHVLQNVLIDTPLVRAPKFKFTVGANYNMPLPAGDEVDFNIDYSWTDEQQPASPFDVPTMPSVGLLNARIAYTSSDNVWSIGIFGTNLTNEYFLNGAIDFAGGYTVGTKILEPGRPRAVGVDFRVNFN